MQGDVETLALLFFCHTNADGELDDVEGHKGDDCRPNRHEQHRFGLSEELGADAGIAYLARDPVDDLAWAAELRCVENAGEKRTESAAESMNPCAHFR